MLSTQLKIEKKQIKKNKLINSLVLYKTGITM